jgi:hypothetical protein
MRAHIIVTAVGRLLICSLAVLASAPLAWTKESRELFSAFAVNMGNVGPKGAQTVDISIERWLSDAERDVLKTALIEKGPRGLLEALKKTPRVGYLRLPGSLGYQLHYAMQVPLEGGGRRILLATDRLIGFREARSNGSDTDYPFTVIEIRLDKDDKGEGKMAWAAHINVNATTHVLEIADYSNEPVRLNAIRKR